MISCLDYVCCVGVLHKFKSVYISEFLQIYTLFDLGVGTERRLKSDCCWSWMCSGFGCAYTGEGPTKLETTGLTGDTGEAGDGDLEAVWAPVDTALGMNENFGLV